MFLLFLSYTCGCRLQLAVRASVIEGQVPNITLYWDNAVEGCSGILFQLLRESPPAMTRVASVAERQNRNGKGLLQQGSLRKISSSSDLSFPCLLFNGWNCELFPNWSLQKVVARERELDTIIRPIGLGPRQGCREFLYASDTYTHKDGRK